MGAGSGAGLGFIFGREWKRQRLAGIARLEVAGELFADEVEASKQAAGGQVFAEWDEVNFVMESGLLWIAAKNGDGIVVGIELLVVDAEDVGEVAEWGELAQDVLDAFVGVRGGQGGLGPGEQLGGGGGGEGLAAEPVEGRGHGVECFREVFNFLKDVGLDEGDGQGGGACEGGGEG